MTSRLLLALSLLLLAPAVGAQSQPWLGLQLVEAPGGVGVDTVMAGSPAEAAGIRPGDVVRSINGEAVSHPRELVDQVVRAGVGSTVSLRVRDRSGAERQTQTVLVVRPDLEKLQRSQLLGRAAPDIDLKGARGIDAPRLRALKGSVILLDFWAPWCRPCLAAMPHLQALYDKFKSKGFKLLGVSTDPWEAVSAALIKRGVSYPQVQDGDGRINSKYFITAIPTLVLIGRDGRVARISVGSIGELEEAVAGLLK